jgi:hypothetical protein
LISKNQVWHTIFVVFPSGNGIFDKPVELFIFDVSEFAAYFNFLFPILSAFYLPYQVVRVSLLRLTGSTFD